MTLLEPAPLEPSSRTPQIAAFRHRAEAVAARPLPTATALHDWSVASSEEFWGTFLDWAELLWDGSPDPVRTGEDVRTARFFPGIRLNYAENVLRPLAGVGDDAPALTSVHGNGSVERFSRGQLRAEVLRTWRALAGLGIGPGDTVLAIAPNTASTAIAALAVAALGAAWSSASPDMGARTLLGRFAQVGGSTLLVDRSTLSREGAAPDDVLVELVRGLPTIQRVLVLDDAVLPDLVGPATARLTDLVTAVPRDDAAPPWPRQAFDSPLFVMFSSGTTGPPKAMVHGIGGTLLEHVKEHRLHGDLGPGDTLYFHTTTAWMMWNWQLSALAVGAHIVVYDGSVAGPETLWQMVSEHGITVFGTSPAYLQLCQDAGYRPRAEVDLTGLRSVLSTGAVLHDWQFRWVAEAVGDVPLQSISGGTDIIGCFVLGHPELPVREGRAQSLGLGLDVAALDDDGRPVLGEVGELVCRNPFPSRPVGFLGDPDGERFRAAYFAENPGLWTHGDRIEIDPDGSARLHGRSDGVLNIDGIRIGPSEIYTIVRRIPGVVDAMAVETRDPTAAGSTRLALLLVLQDGVELDEELGARIRSVLRREGSPAHVPSLLLAVDEVPLTHNGKRSESAARAVLDGQPVRNLAALKNPGSLQAIAEAAARATHTPPSAAEGDDVHDVHDVVARVFAEILGRPVPDDANFFDHGGTSRQSMALLRRLRGELQRPVSMDHFVADPSIRGLDAALTAEGVPGSTAEVLRAGAPDVPPVVFVHGAHGDVDLYRAMVGELDTDAAVYGLTAHPGSEHPIGSSSLADLVRRHTEAFTALVPAGPVRLAGYSFGGLVAYEMARRLAAEGREVTFLALLDVLPPARVLSRRSRRLYRWAALLNRLIPGTSETTVREFLGGTKLAPLVGRTPTPPALSANHSGLAQAERLFHDHEWGPFDGPVSYFRARRRAPVFFNHMYAWRRVAPRLEVVDVPGGHDTLMATEHAPDLATRFSEALRASD